LVQVIFTAQVVNALLLPFVLVFVMRLSADKELMGPLVSGRFLLGVGWLGTGLLILLSVTLAVTSFTGS
jgi:Mn2+/Fe2+ NRAMP family transporter